MLKIILVILVMCGFAHADSESDFQMRVSWVKTMKELMLHLEKKEGHLLVQHERTFLERLKLIDEAWADSRFNCFYGGWPSSKKGKYCQNPSRTNPNYSKTACRENELQCQPLLFGKGHCAPGATQEQRNKSFSTCEEKSGGKYDHLKDLDQKEIDELKEMSILANDVCEGQTTSICKKVKDKVKDGIKALDRAAVQVSSAVVPEPERAPVVVPDVPVVPVVADDTEEEHPEDCEDPAHEHEKLAMTMNQVSSVSLDSMYEKIKEEFLASPMCDPLKIVNDPSERPSALMMSRIMTDVKQIDYIGFQSGPKDEFLKKLSEKWQISPDIQSEVLPMLNQLKSSGTGEIAARIKGLILQDFIKKKNVGPVQEVKEELVKHHIFTKNDKGEIECPFVSKDAFMKAVRGRENMMKKFDVRKKGQITIVDYTRPSNERRMFVIDLNSNKVLHNTWVAHGAGGGSETEGKDGFGSSPDMSNSSGSLKSSDGFILAAQASSGNRFGNNVLLFGADKNNNNISSRGIVIHGWDSPFDSYSTGVEMYDYETGKYGKPEDVVSLLRNADFRKDSKIDMDDTLMKVRVATSTGQFIGATEGCLGVPKINVQHMDRKGRDKNQLELLREDLPGSVIFNYSGPDMESKYF